uniref:Bm9613 n=1 Tax=Brugia malayi TaxID=6279 RepID=A0A1I9G1N8_BRUMA|nr:Bm9613 [Brugia malayi]
MRELFGFFRHYWMNVGRCGRHRHPINTCSYISSFLRTPAVNELTLEGLCASALWMLTYMWIAVASSSNSTPLVA